MFSTLRVAGVAAAMTALCSNAPAAAAQAVPGPPVAPTAMPGFDLNIQNLPTDPAPAATNLQAASVGDVVVTPARIRPDRADDPVAPAATDTGRPARRSLGELVSEHGEADTSDPQFACLASAVYFESRGEPLEGQLAVAEVILNRVASGRFRSTICQVVTQPSQFSFVRRGQIPQAPRGSAAWQRAVAIAHIALQNLHDVTGDDSLFFHATSVRPSWGRPSARIARIGRHVFYR